MRYANIYRAILKRFPDKPCRRPDDINLTEDQVLPIPGLNVAEFQGIAYDSTFNRLQKYILRIGPATCAMQVQVLIQGPPRVRQEEFDADYVRQLNNAPAIPNGPTGYPMPDPETAKRKRAEYEEWLAFQTIVLDVIAPDRDKSGEKALLNPLPYDAGKIPATKLELVPPAHP